MSFSSSSSSNGHSSQTGRPRPTVTHYIALVTKALKQLNQSYVSSETDIINWIINNDNSASPVIIKQAIEQGIREGYFIRFLGPNGPVANPGIILPILNSNTDEHEYESVGNLVQIMLEDDFPILYDVKHDVEPLHG
jgi:hypothetical protein